MEKVPKIQPSIIQTFRISKVRAFKIELTRTGATHKVSASEPGAFRQASFYTAKPSHELLFALSEGLS